MNFIGLLLFLVTTVSPESIWEGELCSDTRLTQILVDISEFRECKKFTGDLIISPELFRRLGSTCVEDEETALAAFSNIRVITGSLIVRDTNLRSLNFLRNLVGVENEVGNQFSISITQNDDLTSLGLYSLKYVGPNFIEIANNRKLCHFPSLDGLRRFFFLNSIFDKMEARRMPDTKMDDVSGNCEKNDGEDQCSRICKGFGCWAKSSRFCTFGGDGMEHARKPIPFHATADLTAAIKTEPFESHPSRFVEELRFVSARQSSEDWEGAASRAIDGNPSGNYWEHSCTHTFIADTTPYWIGEFGERVQVTHVKIFNRLDCCSDRIDGVQVWAGEIFCGSVKYDPEEPEKRAYTVMCPLQATAATQIYITKDGAPLTLCEVTVLGRNFSTPGHNTKSYSNYRSDFKSDLRTDFRSEAKSDFRTEYKSNFRSEIRSEYRSDFRSDFKSDLWNDIETSDGYITGNEARTSGEYKTGPMGVNRIPFWFAEQSSTDWEGKAGRAIDGQATSNYWMNSCTHTLDTNNDKPWWRGNFTKPRRVNIVTVTNRRDCCSERIDGAEVWADETFCGKIRYDPILEAKGSEPYHIKCPAGTTAQSIRIEKSTGPLTLCEVEAYGWTGERAKDGWYRPSGIDYPSSYQPPRTSYDPDYTTNTGAAVEETLSSTPYTPPASRKWNTEEVVSSTPYTPPAEWNTETEGASSTPYTPPAEWNTEAESVSSTPYTPPAEWNTEPEVSSTPQTPAILSEDRVTGTGSAASGSSSKVYVTGSGPAPTSSFEPEPVNYFSSEGSGEQASISTFEPEPVTYFSSEGSGEQASISTFEPEPVTYFNSEGTAEPGRVPTSSFEPEPVYEFSSEGSAEPWRASSESGPSPTPTFIPEPIDRTSIEYFSSVQTTPRQETTTYKEGNNGKLSFVAAKQSSTDTNWSGNAERAIDGDDWIWGDRNSCANTVNDYNDEPWWLGELSQDSVIDSVVIFHTPHASARIDNAEVYAGDTYCGTIYYDEYSLFFTVFCPPYSDPTSVIKITKDSGPLSLCEVEVYGKPVGDQETRPTTSGPEVSSTEYVDRFDTVSSEPGIISVTSDGSGNDFSSEGTTTDSYKTVYPGKITDFTDEESTTLLPSGEYTEESMTQELTTDTTGDGRPFTDVTDDGSMTSAETQPYTDTTEESTTLYPPGEYTDEFMTQELTTEVTSDVRPFTDTTDDGSMTSETQPYSEEQYPSSSEKPEGTGPSSDFKTWIVTNEPSETPSSQPMESETPVTNEFETSVTDKFEEPTEGDMEVLTGDWNLLTVDWDKNTVQPSTLMPMNEVSSEPSTLSEVYSEPELEVLTGDWGAVSESELEVLTGDWGDWGAVSEDNWVPSTYPPVVVKTEKMNDLYIVDEETDNTWSDNSLLIEEDIYDYDGDEMMFIEGDIYDGEEMIYIEEDWGTDPPMVYTDRVAELGDEDENMLIEEDVNDGWGTITWDDLGDEEEELILFEEELPITMLPVVQTERRVIKPEVLKNTGIQFFMEDSKRIGETLRGGVLAQDPSISPIVVENFRVVRSDGGAVDEAIVLTTMLSSTPTSAFITIQIGQSDVDISGEYEVQYVRETATEFEIYSKQFLIEN